MSIRMYYAFRPCGRLSAAGVYDERWKDDLAESIAACVLRGDRVEMVDREEGDPMPEFMCKECRGTSCKEAA